jgi:16S rRNA (adenine1518-N6/adenine1519-N6)-dimethyltransferase
LIRAKKHLGQHFLRDETVSQRIADSVLTDGKFPEHVLEIGPGTGALTKYLLEKNIDLSVIEVDTESVAYLKQHYKNLQGKIFEEDFLQSDLSAFFKGELFTIAGNFPYHISTQILFRVFENRDMVPQVVGMFQKEVAMRVASGHGSKDYGILSVILQAFYSIEYLFTVPESAFIPPPKVKSGVIRLIRNDVKNFPCTDKRLLQVVKAAFNQRRKMLRNSLSGVVENIGEHAFAMRRPEQVSVQEFIELACLPAS